MPTAHPDHATTLAGEPVVIPVLDNDEGEGLHLVGLSQPSNGSIAVHDGDKLRYTPHAGFVGVDSFTYSISDASGGFSSAVVTVEVLAAVPELAAEDDSVTTPRNVPVIVDVLANDSHPPDIAISLLGKPAAGEVQLNGEGTLTYTPALDFVGTVGFGYGIEDAEGSVATATVTVLVEDDNEPPSAGPVTAAATSGSVVAIDVLAAASDPDGDALAIVGLSHPGNGSATIEPDHRVAYQSEPGFVGVDRFLYTVGDGRGGFATGLVTVEVEEVSEPDLPPAKPEILNSTPANSQGQTVTSLTFEHVVPEGSDALVVMVGIRNLADIQVSYDNHTMEQVIAQDHGTSVRSAAFILYDPPVGAHNTVLNFSVNGQPASRRVTAFAHSIAKTGPVSGSVGKGGSVEEISLSVSTNEGLLVISGDHWVGSASQVIAWGEGQTGLDDDGIGGQDSRGSTSWKRAEAVETPMITRIENGGGGWAAIAVAISPAAEGEDADDPPAELLGEPWSDGTTWKDGTGWVV